MRTITVKVTAEDIRAGVRENATRCPVAHAVRRATGEPNVCVPCCAFVWIGPMGERGTAELPTWVGEKIQAYDGGMKMKPFEFEVEVPQ